jgi:hypothetical protein
MKDNALRLERSPITGKVEIIKPSISTLTPSTLVWLVFSEGLAAWNILTQPEKDEVANYIYSEWKDALRTKKQRVVVAFLGNMLINMHTGKNPVHGEYDG